VDGDAGTYWATGDSTLSASVELSLSEAAVLNAVLIREFIALGQRIESFAVDVLEGETWREVAAGTTIGNRRILRFEDATADAIRIRFVGRAAPVISSVQAYRVPPVAGAELAGPGGA
jgi:alpha-L-fucosidase